MMDALGMIELNSVAAGIEASDSMLKIAATTLTAAHPVCSGKFIVMVRGEVAAVKSSVEAGVKTSGENLVDSLLIPNVNPQVFRAVAGAMEVPEGGAIGVIETFSLASCIYASDAAVKAADVTLIEVRLGRGLGGKSYVVMTGDVSSVNEAVRVGKSAPECLGMIVRTAVIAAPHESVKEALI